MANPLRNAMVYLGLAEEDAAAPVQRAQTSSQSRATESADRQRRAGAAPQYSAQQERGPAPVTPIHTAAVQRPATPTTQAAEAMNEILTVHPKAYDKDAQVIAEHFRNGIPVIMNLSQMTDGDARRVIDFASGLSQGLEGRIERVTSRVFLLTPKHVSVHGDERGAQEQTFFA